jgi:hypothetical protein
VNLSTYLGNGQPLSKKTTVVPIGRGPFTTFLAGALDAIRLQGMDKLAPWTIEKVLFWLERFNGQGYAAHNVNSPYVWSWTNLYTAGKFTSDHGFDAGAVDKQGGCAAILKAIFILDPSTKPERETAQTVTSPAVAAPSSPVAQRTEVQPMSPSDTLTSIENALTAAQNELPSILGIISTFVPQLKPLLAFFPLLGVAINAVKVVQQATGGSTQDAMAQVTAHLSPTLPNAAVLSGQPQGSGA